MEAKLYRPQLAVDHGQWSVDCCLFVNGRPLIEVTFKPYFLWEALNSMCHPHQLYPELQSAVDSGLSSVDYT